MIFLTNLIIKRELELEHSVTLVQDNRLLKQKK